MSEKELEPLKPITDKKIPNDADHAANSPSTRRESKIRRKFLACISNNLFMLSTILGVIIGFIIGFVVREMKPSSTVLLWIQMPGTIFIRILTLTVLPLIVGSVIIVTSKLDPKANGKISLISFTFIVIANVTSSCIGLFLAIMIQPGNMNVKNETLASDNSRSLSKMTTGDVFADLMMNIFPDNLVAACFSKTQTIYKKKYDQSIHTLTKVMTDVINSGNSSLPMNMSSAMLNQAVILEERTSDQVHAMNMIGIIFISCTFGIASRLAGEKAQPFLTFFESATEVVTVVMKGFLWYTPVGACFMIAGSVAGVESILSTFQSLGFFVLTVVAGLLMHFLLLVLVLFLVSRRNPFRLLKYMFPSWFISFVTTVPVISIPEMYECCDKFGIKKRVSRIVVPFAAAMKGDGSAVFIAAATVFVTQISNYEMDIGNYVVIGLLTSSAAMALPNIPSGAIVIIITICSSIGCPSRAAALLFAMEWLLDRLRSGNITVSHLYCTAVTNALCKGDLDSANESEFKDSRSSSSKHINLDTMGDCIIKVDDIHQMEDEA